MPDQCEIAAVTPERIYIRPHPALRRAVSHYTVFRPLGQEIKSGPPSLLNIIPDASGCLVLPLAEASFVPRLWGPTSRAVEVAGDSGRASSILFVEFRPGGANRLLNMSLGALENLVLPLAEVDAPLAAAITRLMSAHYDLGGAGDFLSLAGRLDRLLLSRLEKTDESHPASFVLSELDRGQGQARAAEIARRSGYSARHLNRILSDRLGLNLKLLSRIVRINAACRAMSGSGISLTELAQRLGYHDQAHFIHDFKAVCGVSPGSYLARMSDFYNEELKMAGKMPSK